MTSTAANLPNSDITSMTPDRAARLLTQAATAYRATGLDTRPDSAEIVTAMLVLERSAQSGAVTLPELLGTWRLAFVTGTTKTRKRAGKAIGAGRYLPAIPQITLAYSADNLAKESESGSNSGSNSESSSGSIAESIAESSLALGRAVNTVAIGGVTLTVTGPIEAIAGKQILAFDFTRWSVAIGGWVVYRGEIGGGAASEATFADRPLKNRPFFNYFWVSDGAIAARGKGGGLAMWVRMPD